ncbi:MAG: alpha/beta hydrolase, partial [Dorea sp.]
MAINKSMRKVLKALSFDGIEVEASRHLANLKAIDPLKIFHKTIDYKIYNGDYEVPVRLYLPDEAVSGKLPVLLFFHGGG